MPYPPAAARPDLPAIERRILARWADNRTFARSVDQRPADDEYVFYDGPPFANGLPHHGHLLTGYVKDVVPRYQTMRGRRVERRFGWDCHGLPAEMEAEKELPVSGRASIIDYGIERFNEHCRTSVLRYTAQWEKIVTRQARWVDFGNDYKTMDLHYMESVMWAFKQLWDKGLIYRANRVLPYSWGAETPLSNHEIRLDDATRPRQDPAITVAFRLEDPSGIPTGDALTEQGAPAAEPGLSSSAADEAARAVDATADGAQAAGGASADKLSDGGIAELDDAPVTEDAPGERHGAGDVFGAEGAATGVDSSHGVGTDGEHAGERSDGPVFLLAWTTTPWTLPSNLALAVGADIDYAVMRLGDGTRWILAEAAVDAYVKQLEGAVQVGVVKGSDLAGRSYEPLFDYFADMAVGQAGADPVSAGSAPATPASAVASAHGASGTDPVGARRPAGRAFVVLAADFVDTAEGTGVVHAAPGFGEDDQRLAEEAGIAMVVPVDESGRFTAEVRDFAGQNVLEANPAIIRRLRDDGILVRHDSYTHNYPHCWRTDTPVIYRAMPSWYVKVSAIRERMLGTNAEINWIPGHIRDGRFGMWLAGARDWSISRNRFWGSPIPVWVSDDPAYPRTDVYGSLDEIEADFGVRPDNLHRPFIDELVRPNPDDPTGRSMMRRVHEVLDCWFESGSMPFASVHYPFENAEWFDEHFPADFIVEYINQSRGWFYTLHVLATALFDRPAFQNVICHGILLAEDGQKLSKKLRNYTEPGEIFERQGADALRWYLTSAGIVRGGDMRISDRGIDDVVRTVILPIYNAFSFFVLYANVEGHRAEYRPDPGADAALLDRYILAKTGALVAEVTERMDAYDLPAAAAAIVGFVDALNNWHIRRSRDRFWGTHPAHPDVSGQAAPSAPGPGSPAGEIAFSADLAGLGSGSPGCGSASPSDGAVGGRADSADAESGSSASADDSAGIARARAGGSAAVSGSGSADAVPGAVGVQSPAPDGRASDTEVADGAGSRSGASADSQGGGALGDAVSGSGSSDAAGTGRGAVGGRADPAALDTLYTVLVTLAKIAAPFLPMIAEEIYVALTAEPGGGKGGAGVTAVSVHLEDWPDAGEFVNDTGLVEAMDRLRSAASAGLALREAKGLRVRLPLSSVTVAGRGAAALDPFADLLGDELNVKQVHLTDEIGSQASFVLRPDGRLVGPRLGADVQAVYAAARAGDWTAGPDGTVEVAGHILSEGEYRLDLQAAEGVAAAALPTNDAVVTLDTAVTPELEAEGLARDVVREIQNARKAEDLVVTDRIVVRIDSSSEALRAAVEAHRAYIAGEVLAVDLAFGSSEASASGSPEDSAGTVSGPVGDDASVLSGDSGSRVDGRSEAAPAMHADSVDQETRVHEAQLGTGRLRFTITPTRRAKPSGLFGAS